MLVARIEKIENGFILTDEQSGHMFYLPVFSVAAMLSEEYPGQHVDHESALRRMVMDFDLGGGKIPPIKAVRDYCIGNGYDRYRGLKEAKDFVESFDRDWYYRHSL
jgi:ribosomal protein L7/L12